MSLPVRRECEYVRMCGQCVRMNNNPRTHKKLNGNTHENGCKWSNHRKFLFCPLMRQLRYIRWGFLCFQTKLLSFVIPYRECDPLMLPVGSGDSGDSCPCAHKSRNELIISRFWAVWDKRHTWADDLISCIAHDCKSTDSVPKKQQQQQQQRALQSLLPISCVFASTSSVRGNSKQCAMGKSKQDKEQSSSSSSSRKKRLVKSRRRSWRRGGNNNHR